MSGLLEILFSGGAGLDKLASLRVWRGEVLIEQDAPSEAMYFVVAGRFRVERNGQTVGHIEAGSVLGEIGFFTGMPRTARVIAFRDSLVIRLTRAEYDAHCDRFPGLREGIIAELASRLADRYREHETATRDRTRPRTLALIATGDAGLPETLPRRLCAVLGDICRAQTISRDRFRAEAAGAAPDSIEGVDWFSRNEREADLTLYLPEPGDDAWQQAIIRQSDQVVFVARPGRPPPLAPIEEFALTHIPRGQRRLLRLHRKRRERVAGTAEWLRSRPVAIHHHAILNDDVDLARLARFLTGTARGLVLSGGGAYGLAHVGIERALSRDGMGFDIFGGTSVGSAMASAFALGVSGEALTDRIHDIFVRARALRRVTLPLYSLLDHKRFDDKLREHFTDLDIADIWLPFYAVATDLDLKQPEIIRTGPLWEAIRASSALPGILPPFIRDGGGLLVDGGILDNLPCRAMHGIKAGPNVVVSLTRQRTQPEGYSYGRIPGRAALIGALMRPGRWRERAAPSVAETIIRSMMAGRTQHGEGLARDDWLLAPPLPVQMGFMNWRDAFSLVEPADRYAAQQIAALSQSRPDLYRALLAAPPS